MADSNRMAKESNFWRGIYNKDKNYILGRTPKNWGKQLCNHNNRQIIESLVKIF